MGQHFNKSDSLVDFDGKGKYSSPEFIWQDTVATDSYKVSNKSKIRKPV